MARPNKGRRVFAEDHLARRIELERTARGWTYDGMAARLTEAGCPINGSALYKIEKGHPPRRIALDEAIAASRVFGVPVIDLVADPAVAGHGVLPALLDELRVLRGRRDEAEREWELLAKRINQEVGAVSKSGGAIARAFVVEYMTELSSSSVGAPELADGLPASLRESGENDG